MTLMGIASPARLSGKVALVTGASAGIGEAAAKALAAQGARVVLAARRRKELERVAAEIADAGGEAAPVPTDALSDEDLAAAVGVAEERFGGLDIAFNCAGVTGTLAPIADRTPESWRADIDAILGTVFYSMRNEIPAMVRRGGGVIINNGSVYGLIGSGQTASAYVAAKHGVHGLTRDAALELAPHNVRVNAIAFGTVLTSMIENLIAELPGFEEASRAAQPIGRFATPAEAGALVAYLAGDDASFFTGAVITMDGGWTAH
jgi:NAD(P)-dependent dehydrogenase (short-subunit alcohol dehydrogenase family)